MKKKAENARSVLVLALLLVGCQSLPNVTHTGDVKEILVTEQLSPSALTVNAGDEVRWINRRTAPVRIIFLEPVNGKLSCKNGFGGFMEPTESAILDPNESASVCFREAGSLRYAVKIKSANPSDDINVSGVIRVEERAYSQTPLQRNLPVSATP